MDLSRQLQSLYQKALTLKSKGNASEAAEVEVKAAELLKNLRSHVELHPEALETADALLFLAEREWTIRGDDPAVQSLLERAIRIRESHLGPNHPAVAEPLAALAEFHFLAGRWGEAEPLYQRAIRVGKETLDSSIYAKACGGLAQTLTHLGRGLEAEPFFAKAIELCGDSENDKRVLYFLYIFRAEGLEKAGRTSEAEASRAAAQKLLPRGNPGEAGFHV